MEPLGRLTTVSNPLREERAYFAELKPQLLESHTGQFAVIRGRELFGVFPQQDDAFVKGVKRFKRGAFLIAGIVEHDDFKYVPTLPPPPTMSLEQLVSIPGDLPELKSELAGLPAEELTEDNVLQTVLRHRKRKKRLRELATGLQNSESRFE